jgi:hypothetical protein
LSPVLLGMAACAAVYLLGRRLRWRQAIPWVTGAVFGLAMGSVVATRSVYYSNEIGHSRDMVAVTAFLRPLVGAGDHVSSTLISSMPAYYYFRRAGIPKTVLGSRRGEPRRLFAIEDKIPFDPLGDTEDAIMANLDLVLRIDGFDTDQLPPRQLIWESQWSRIWLYDPLPGR